MIEQQASHQANGHCTVFTKLMENYRLSSSFRVGAQIQAIRRPDGSDEFFAIRNDGYIERFYIDPNSSTGYTSQTMLLHGSFIAAVQDAEGKSLIFAAQAEQIYYLEETEPGSSEFGKPSRVSASLPYNARKVTGIFARLLNQEVWLGALIEAGPSPEDLSTYVVYGKWNGHDTHLENSGLTVTCSQCTWCGQGDEEPTFVIFGETIMGISALTGSVHYFPDPKPKPSNSACLDADVIYDSEIAQDVLLVVFGDGSLYALSTKEGGNWFRLNQDDLKLTTIRACSDPLNNVHLFALSKAGMLHHGFLTLKRQEPLSLLAPIKTDVRDLAVSEISSQDPAVFAPSSQNEGLVYYLLYEAASSNWNIQDLTLPSTDKVQRYSSYATEITAHDSYGVPLPMTPVWIWAKEHTRIEVNGSVCFVGPRTKVRLQTDAMGQLSLAQETGLLSVPEIFVQFGFPANNAKGLRRTGENTLVVNQFAPVKKRFETITGDDLRKAVKADGKPLLDDRYRTEETTNALASALLQCMDYVPKTQIMGTLASNKEDTSAGCFWANPEFLDSVGQLRPSPGNTGWALEKKDGKIVYQTLTAQEESQLLTEAENAMLGLGGIRSFFKRLGDLIRAAAEKVVEVVKVAVTAIGPVVQTVITYVKDKVEYLLQAVVQNAQMVFDVVESIFDQVEVFFEDLFEWLAYIFNWDDILRTKDIIVYSILELVKLAEKTVEYAGQKLDDALTKALEQTKTAFEEVVKKIDPNVSVGATINGTGFGIEPDPRLSDAISNNFLLTQFLKRDMAEDCSQALPSPVLAVDQSAFDEFKKILDEMVKTVEDNEAFSKAVEYFKDMFSTPDKMFSLMLCGLIEVLEGLTVVVLASAKAAIKALLKLVKTLFQAIYSVLNTEIKLPFISSFYSQIAHAKLTFVELPALLISLPATILHKNLTGKAPFKDKAAMDRFKGQFNSQRLYNFIIHGHAKTVHTSVGIGKIPQAVLYIMYSITIGSAAIYYGLSGINDHKSISGHVPWMSTWGAIVSELVWFGMDNPWSPYSLNSIPVTEITNWAVIGIGVVLDFVFALCAKAIPENLGNDVCTLVTFIYGLAYLGEGICCIVDQSRIQKSTLKLEKPDYILYLVPPLICVSKIGLIKALVKASKGTSWETVVALNFGGGGPICIAMLSYFGLIAKAQL